MEASNAGVYSVALQCGHSGRRRSTVEYIFQKGSLPVHGGEHRGEEERRSVVELNSIGHPLRIQGQCFTLVRPNEKPSQSR